MMRSLARLGDVLPRVARVAKLAAVAILVAVGTAVGLANLGSQMLFR